MTIEEVKKKSILDVAADLGVSLRRVSGTVYERVDHDSFKIFSETNTFKWFSRDIQGDVINFVQLIQGVSFKEAVSYLQNGEFHPVKIVESKKEPFQYYLSPYENTDFGEAKRYLQEERQLSEDTISFFHARGLLAETIKKTNAYFEPLLVFKYMDSKGNLTGASLQGIRENRTLYDRGRLKQIMKHSDGTMGMSVDIGEPQRLVFLEAPIDLMSYYEMRKDRLSDVRLVAMEGLKEGTISRYVLEMVGQLQGKEEFIDQVAPSKYKQTLEALLKTTTFFNQHPDMITLAVDNDKAGLEFINKLQGKGYPLQVDLPQLVNNQEKMDWNDLLKYEKSRQIFRSDTRRLEDMINAAQKEAGTIQGQPMVAIYEYSEKAATLFNRPTIDKEKFAFLLANHNNIDVYNQYAIQEEYSKEMMAMTSLYNECKGEQFQMLDRAIDRGFIEAKEAFLRQYAKDFIKPNLDNQAQNLL